MAKQITGLKELSRQLSDMGKAAGGKALKSAAFGSMLPVVKQAKLLIPVGSPPYEGRDPYPVRSYKGHLRTPGFAKRNIARKSILSTDGQRVSVMVGVRPEAFYAISFIEFGTSKIPKKPWLEPAFRQALPAVNRVFQTKLKTLIDKAAR